LRPCLKKKKNWDDLEKPRTQVVGRVGLLADENCMLAGVSRQPSRTVPTSKCQYRSPALSGARWSHKLTSSDYPVSAYTKLHMATSVPSAE
jgi:hypothetical protein